jgi:hypothetical protein
LFWFGLVWLGLANQTSQAKYTACLDQSRSKERQEVYYCQKSSSLFGWLVADGWCWFVLREEYCWLVVGSWFVVREKYCWLVADKPSEHGVDIHEYQSCDKLRKNQTSMYVCMYV